MTYKEIFEAEKRRTIQDLYEVRFYQEGVWWKAFEWSVYLYEKFMSNEDILKDKKLLNILKKYTVQHEDGSIVIIGMPIEAFNNFLPSIKRFKIVDDKEIVFDLSNYRKATEEINSYLNLDNYEEFLSIWKSSLPFTESSKKYKPRTQIKALQIEEEIYNEENDLISNIVDEILKYPIENKTLIENTQFLINVREKLNKLIQ